MNTNKVIFALLGIAGVMPSVYATVSMLPMSQEAVITRSFPVEVRRTDSVDSQRTEAQINIDMKIANLKNLITNCEIQLDNLKATLRAKEEWHARTLEAVKKAKDEVSAYLKCALKTQTGLRYSEYYGKFVMDYRGQLGALEDKYRNKSAEELYAAYLYWKDWQRLAPHCFFEGSCWTNELVYLEHRLLWGRACCEREKVFSEKKACCRS